MSGVTLLRTADTDYSRHRLREIGVHPMGKLWAVWGGGLALSYVWAPARWQPVAALCLGTAWCGYISARLHRPCAPVQTDMHVEEYLREHRRWSSTS